MPSDARPGPLGPFGPFGPFDPPASSAAGAAAIANLRIHVEPDDPPPSGLRRLRGLYAPASRPARTPLVVRIQDLQGHAVIALDDAGPNVEFGLPAGTYHVTTRLGGVQRCHTLNLPAGGTFELTLNRPKPE